MVQMWLKVNRHNGPNMLDRLGLSTRIVDMIRDFDNDEGVKWLLMHNTAGASVQKQSFAFIKSECKSLRLGFPDMDLAFFHWRTSLNVSFILPLGLIRVYETEPTKHDLSTLYGSPHTLPKTNLSEWNWTAVKKILLSPDNTIMTYFSQGKVEWFLHFNCICLNNCNNSKLKPSRSDILQS